MLNFEKLFLLIFFVGFWHRSSCQDISPVAAVDTTFKAAKYSIIINLGQINNIVPEVPTQFTAFEYYIQYGNDRIIEISDPGIEISNLPVDIMDWDFKTNIKTEFNIYNNVRRFYESKDTFSHYMIENRCIITKLCDQGFSHLFCDSLLITNIVDSFQTKIYLQGIIRNIPVFDLFYPYVQYLPKKIVPLSSQRGIRVLEEVLYGKEDIDVLLLKYSLMEFDRISEQEMKFNISQLDMELIKRIIPD